MNAEISRMKIELCTLTHRLKGVQDVHHHGLC